MKLGLRVIKPVFKQGNNTQELERIRRETRDVLDELYKEKPEETSWTIRKGLSPGFKKDEFVLFRDQHGKLLQGRVLNIGSAGAHIISSDWPQNLNYVPGKSIIKKIGLA